MRIFEIASAQEQIELWKLVSNSVWQSLEQQERDEQQRAAAEAAARKKQPKAKGRAKSVVPAYTPPPPLPNKPAQQSANVEEPSASNTQTAARPLSNAEQQTVGLSANTQNGVKNAISKPAYALKKTDAGTDDRYSKNTRRGSAGLAT